MENNEIHLLRVVLTVRKISLTVRFPCSLSFQLRADSNTVENRHTYQLKNGQCTPNQSIILESDFQYNPTNKKYVDRKIFLTVFMNSPNGKIPAGTATSIISNQDHRSPIEHTFALEKCPDKAAQIVFLQSVEFIRKRPNNYNSGVGLTTNLKYSSVTSLTPKGGSSYRERSPIVHQVKRQRDNSRGKDSKYRLQSSLIRQGQDSERSAHSRVLLESNEEELTTQQHKVLRLEKEKAQYIKELAKLKAQLHTMHLQAQDRQSEDNIYLITEQLEKAKDKIKIYERNQRQMAMTIRELKEEVEKKKNKVQHNETQKTELEHSNDQKDRAIKQLQAVRKRLQDRLQDMNLQTSSLLKRIQFKESAFKDQMKKMTDKYNQCETQRQQATSDYNNLLTEMQNNERKNQLATKQRERIAYQEKSKLAKKVDQLTKSVASLQEDLSDRENMIRQLNQSGKRFELSEQEKGSEIARMTVQLQKYMDKLKKESDLRHSLQKDIEVLKIAEEERNNYRKKYNETTQELARYRQKFERASANCLQLQTKIQQYEDLLKQKGSQKAEVEQRLSSLNKDFENLKKTEERKYREAETLSVQNYSAGQKITELRNKLAQEKDRFTQLEQQYNDQVTFLMKQKEQLIAQVDEMKWVIEKNKQNYQELLEKLRTLNEEKLVVHRENLQQTERISKLNQALNQSKADIETMMSHQETMELKDKQSQRSLKQKSENIYQLTKKVQSLEQSVYSLKEKVSHYQVFYAQKLGSEEATSKEKENLVLQKIEQITQLQLELMSKNEQIVQREQEIKIKVNQNLHMKDQQNNFKASLDELQSVNQGLRLQIEETNDEISRLRSDLKIKIEQILTLERSHNKLKSEWDDYKSQVEKALQQLVKEVSKDEDSSNNKLNLLAFPDVNLSMLQVQAVKKRNSIIGTYRDKVSALEEAKKVVETEMAKNKSYYNEREVEYEAEVKKWKTTANQTLSQLSAEKHQLFQQIKLNQEKITELISNNEKLQIEIASINQMLEQSNHDYLQLAKEKQGVQNQLKTAEEHILRFKSDIVKQKTMTENEVTALLERSTAQEQKSKILIGQQQRKISNLQKTLIERDENIRKLEASLSNLSYEKDKLSQTSGDQSSKISEFLAERRQNDRDKQVLNKNIKQLTEDLERTELNLSQEQVKNKELQRKNSNLQQEYTVSQVQLEKKKAQISQLEQAVDHLEKSLRERGEQGKIYGEKNSGQIKTLQEKIIQLKSEIDLKNFVIDQKQATIVELNISKDQIQTQLNKRRTELQKTESRVQQLKCELLFRGQSEETLNNEKSLLQDQLDQAKQKISTMERQLSTLNGVCETLQMRQEQLAKTKQELINAEQLIDRQSAELRVSTADNRKELVSRNSKEDELRRRIRELQKLLEEKDIDMSNDRKKWSAELDRDKKQLQTIIANLQRQNRALLSEGDYQRDQLSGEVQMLNSECLNLQGIIAEKEQLIRAQDAQISQYETKIQDLTAELKNCLEVWDKEKTAYMASKKQMNDLQGEMGRFQKYANQLDNRSKQLLQVSRKKVSQQGASGIAEVLREVEMAVMKSKTKALGRASNQQDKQNIISDFKTVQEKIDMALRAQHARH